MASSNDPEIAPSSGSHEDTPPGTFLLITGTRPAEILLCEISISTDNVVENEEYMGHLRAIMLSPFPSTDPNEPLVRCFSCDSTQPS